MSDTREFEMPTEAELVSAQALALGCLTNPPLYNRDPGSPAFGGLDGIHCFSKRTRFDEPFVYTEITGYAVLLFLKVATWTDDQQFVEFAHRAGNWIIKAQYGGPDPRAHGGFFDRYYKSRKGFYPYLYTYPASVCCAALMRLYEALGGNEFLAAAVKAADWIVDVMWTPLAEGQGAFKERYHLPTGSFSWSLHPYEALCTALTLKKVSETTREPRYWDVGRKAAAWGLATQHEDGGFPLCLNASGGRNAWDHICYTHFVAYTLYNLVGYPLLDLFEATGENSFLEAAFRCADWLLRNRDPSNGGLFTYYYVNGPHSWHQQSPTVAQAVCAWSRMYALSGRREYRSAVWNAVRWLLTKQHKVTDDEHLAGGFHWIHPNESKGLLHGVHRFTYRFARRFGRTLDYLPFVDRIPTWAVEFAVEAFHEAKRLRA